MFVDSCPGLCLFSKEAVVNSLPITMISASPSTVSSTTYSLPLVSRSSDQLVICYHQGMHTTTAPLGLSYHAGCRNRVQRFLS